jgi:hypothetical protein
MFYLPSYERYSVLFLTLLCPFFLTPNITNSFVDLKIDILYYLFLG